MTDGSFFNEYAFLITLLFIGVATMVGAFFRRRSRDKCLKDFTGFPITIEQIGGKAIWGKLRLEHTGLELCYAEPKRDVKGHIESSFIIYKNEFPSMLAVVRFHDDLDDRQQTKRLNDLKKTYQPGFFRRSYRRFVNFFKTIRDSITEVINLLIAQAKKTGSAGAVLSGQDKYVNQMKQEVIGSVGTSFEPLLERHIGHRVVLELLKGETLLELSGVLREYTAEFIEVMDVDYAMDPRQSGRKADLIVLRKYAIVRHLGE